ncbi:MAG: hypothetical protein KBT34_10505 [Prevotella sp.]|nr:hypothetical protein [Candidatus Prevotella equi]
MTQFNHVSADNLNNFKYVAKRHVPNGKVYVFGKKMVATIKPVGEVYLNGPDTETRTFVSIARDNKRGIIYLRDEYGCDFSPREFTDEFIEDLTMYIANYNNGYKIIG